MKYMKPAPTNHHHNHYKSDRHQHQNQTQPESILTTKGTCPGAHPTNSQIVYQLVHALVQNYHPLKK